MGADQGRQLVMEGDIGLMPRVGKDILGLHAGGQGLFFVDVGVAEAGVDGADGSCAIHTNTERPHFAQILCCPGRCVRGAYVIDKIVLLAQEYRSGDVCLGGDG